MVVKQVNFSLLWIFVQANVGSNDVYVEHMNPILSGFFSCKDQTFKLKGGWKSLKDRFITSSSGRYVIKLLKIILRWEKVPWS